jgi:hypothetical protein
MKEYMFWIFELKNDINETININDININDINVNDININKIKVKADRSRLCLTWIFITCII